MLCLEISGAVRPIYGSLGVKRLINCCIPVRLEYKKVLWMKMLRFILVNRRVFICIKMLDVFQGLYWKCLLRHEVLTAARLSSGTLRRIDWWTATFRRIIMLSSSSSSNPKRAYLPLKLKVLTILPHLCCLPVDTASHLRRHESSKMFSNNSVQTLLKQA